MYERSRLNAGYVESAFVLLIVLKTDVLVLTEQGPADKRTLLVSHSYRDLNRAGRRWP
jgi:hypothetical protein